MALPQIGQKALTRQTIGTTVKCRQFINLAGKKKKKERKKVKLKDNKSIKYRDKICLHEAAECLMLHQQRYERERAASGWGMCRLLSAPARGVKNYSSMKPQPPDFCCTSSNKQLLGVYRNYKYHFCFENIF